MTIGELLDRYNDPATILLAGLLALVLFALDRIANPGNDEGASPA